MKPPPFEYARPESLEEALELLAEHGDEAKPLAGGQSLVPLLNMRLARPALVVDLNRLPGLDGIAEESGAVRAGALVRQAAFERSQAVRGRLPVVAACLPHVGHHVTRNRGTVGGSIAHADAKAELPLALLALGGSAVVRSARGERTIPAEDLFLTHYTTTLEPDELLVATVWPDRGPAAGFAEVAFRAGDYAIAMAACALRLEGGRVVEARVAVAGPADRPRLLAGAGSLLVGEEPQPALVREVAEAVRAEVDPGDALHASARYQRHVVGVVVERALLQAVERGRDGRVPGPGTGTGSRGPAVAPGAATPADPAGPGTAGPAGRVRAGHAPVTGAGTGLERTRPVHVVVNGRTHNEEVEPRLLLSDFLRHTLGLTGTHVGCEHGVCGACTVRLDGTAVRSCLLLAVQADGAAIQTVEGLAPDGALHPLQEAFREKHALQCGFCTPGILMAAADFLEREPAPRREQVVDLLSGHLCRCTGYEPIVEAIVRAAARP